MSAPLADWGVDGSARPSLPPPAVGRARLAQRARECRAPSADWGQGRLSETVPTLASRRTAIFLNDRSNLLVLDFEVYNLIFGLILPPSGGDVQKSRVARKL